MTRLLLLVGSIVFAESMFFAVVAPLLPHYEDELGLSKTAAGIMLAAYPAGLVAASLPSGLLAARLGAKRTVLAGLGLIAVASVVFAFAKSVAVIDLARFVQGVGGACAWAGGLAWLIGESPAERRGQLVGSAMAAAVGGTLFGPVVGGLAAALGAESVFTAVAGLAVALALWALVVPGGARRAVEHPGLRRVVGADGLLIGMWLVALPALGLGVLDTLVPLRLDELGATETAVAAAFLVAAAAEACVSPLVGHASDRHGRAAPIRIGLVVAAVFALALPLPGVAVAVAALLVLTAAGLGMFWAPAIALVSDVADRAGVDLGPTFGLVNLAVGGGMVVGAAAGGAIAEATSDVVPFALLAGLCAITLARLVLPGRGVTPALAAET